jgi:site-specific recombinase XerD
MKLDKFHYHEALHTTHIIQMMIQRELIEHPVGAKKSNKKSLKSLNKAMGHLEEFYQYCAQRGDEIE